MPTTLGSNSVQTIFFKGFTGDSVFEEFVANSAIEEGQFIKLRSDGKVEPAASGDNQALIIGVAMQKAAANANVTVNMRGFGTIMAEGSASMSPGPVKFASFTSGTKLNRVAAAAATNYFVAATSGGSPTTSVNMMDPAAIGWALDASTNAGDQVRVVVRN